jgi:hypothetical protein
LFRTHERQRKMLCACKNARLWLAGLAWCWHQSGSTTAK